jgi:hypothetical protein
MVFNREVGHCETAFHDTMMFARNASADNNLMLKMISSSLFPKTMKDRLNRNFFSI